MIQQVGPSHWFSCKTCGLPSTSHASHPPGRAGCAKYDPDTRPMPESATSPPPPCTGAGLVPPYYQGMVGFSSTAFEAAPCAICGQVVAVDGHQRTVNHPYRIIDGAP